MRPIKHPVKTENFVNGKRVQTVDGYVFVNRDEEKIEVNEVKDERK